MLPSGQDVEYKPADERDDGDIALVLFVVELDSLKPSG